MAKVISAAINAGYRHIDTAKIYGTEPLIGPVLTEVFKSGELKREDVFITCKVRQQSLKLMRDKPSHVAQQNAFAMHIRMSKTKSCSVILVLVQLYM